MLGLCLVAPVIMTARAPLPLIIESDVKRQCGAEVVGRTDEIRARFHAISPERQIKNPAVVAIRETAREELFSSD